MADTAISRERITAAEEVIRPYIRRTPVIAIDGTDIGLGPIPLRLKLEQLQHSGSFKARGAFANLLMRKVPPTGVVAASGGNHGAAVAYAAKTLGVAAKIFVPSISSPAKIARIRDYGADLVVGGERYADALAASERWAAETGALPVHAFDQDETLLGQGTVGLELAEQAPELDTLLVAVGGGGLIGGIAAWYAGAVRGDRRRAGGRAHADASARGRTAGRRGGGRHRRRLAGAAPDRRAGVPDRPRSRGSRRAGHRRGDPPGARDALGEHARRRGARRRRRLRGARSPAAIDRSRASASASW